ncbi:MAG: class I SAM-dependent methyltransferase [Candidatus Bathyarchaeia archaeon]|jgi:ubiquinone/menaquinone biosynthesis C-methylase UbiE
MTCHGGFALDEATRRSWYNPEALLQDLRADMIFIDVGCGDGFFSILAAKKVGEKGKVYAVDSDASAIEKLGGKAQAGGLRNIVSKVSSAEETVFCNGCADYVFFSMVLHDFADPTRVLQNARKMIKPTGKLIDLDWKKRKMHFGPPFKIRFSQDYASSLIRDAGFQIDGVIAAGNYHYVITAKPLL